ncbi:MAG: hypothetical protein ACOY93_03730 [Bacillota bacterium]
MKRWGSLLLMLTVLLLSPRMVGASAAPAIMDGLLPVEGTLYNPCTMEDLTLSGEARVRVTREASGYDISVTFTDLTGVGYLSGDLYRIPAGEYTWSYAGQSMRDSDSRSTPWYVMGWTSLFRTRAVTRLALQDGNWRVQVYFIEATCR